MENLSRGFKGPILCFEHYVSTGSLLVAARAENFQGKASMSVLSTLTKKIKIK